jgi:adenylate cyclase
MPQEGFKRKLTAILSADVVGYSRLMEDNEEATIQTINSYRNSMTTLVQQHRGRVVDTTGDNLMAEFASVVDAVKCAVETQKEMGQRNADLQENRRMLLRIGINLGDIVEEGDRIYGDGVNIAARLEGLAEAGGICISGTVYDQVKNKLPFQYEYQGQQTVKNSKEPVRVYQVILESLDENYELARAKKSKQKNWLWLVLAAILILFVGIIITLILSESKPQKKAITVEKVADPSLGKPSIAVLPFDNLSDDPKQEYFTDGMTDELITNLSKISGLSVISRNSSFTYKGKSVKLQQVASELNVRYVLEGSVQRAGDRVRIRAQLIDGATDHHLWAESYDAVMKNIFDLQDEITKKIAAALAVKLTEDEKKRVARKYTENMEAYESFLQGLEYQNRYTKKEETAKARQMYERAIELDPEFALAYALLGLIHVHEWAYGWSQDPKSLEQAFELAQRAITLDDSLPIGHHVLGEIYLWEKQHELAIAELEKTTTLDPNYANGYVVLGGILNWAGRPEEAIGLIKKAMRLNPRYRSWYLWELGHAYFLTGRHEEAIETFKKAIDRNPDYMPAYAYLAASYSELGREEEARAEAAEFSRLSPQTSSEAWRQRLPYKDQAVLERLFDSLRKAGLK